MWKTSLWVSFNVPLLSVEHYFFKDKQVKAKASEKESTFSGDTAKAAGSKSILTGDISLDKIDLKDV